MASSVKGKTFIITGGASGIGLATTSALLNAGAQVAICDISQPGLSAFLGTLKEDQHSRVLARSVDITDRPAVEAFLVEAKEQFGSINGCANIAGTAGRRLGHEEIWQVDERQYNHVMDINVRGAFHVLGGILKPQFLEEPGSSILHVSSMYGEKAFPKGSIYSASKHAGIGLVKSAAAEAAKRGIRVNIVTP